VDFPLKPFYAEIYQKIAGRRIPNKKKKSKEKMGTTLSTCITLLLWSNNQSVPLCSVGKGVIF
jgi:hypothetical protein